MSLESSTLNVTLFNMLPIERKKELENGTATPEEIRESKKKFRSKIENRMSGDLEHDDTAMPLVGRLGSDTMINALVCNFKVEKEVNNDVIEAN